MSMNGGPDPRNRELNSELADEQDIAVMESLAASLLVSIPAELHRRYARITDNGAIAMFGTFSYEEDQTSSLQATIALARADCENVQFMLTFSHDNECSISYQGLEAMPKIARIAQELLDDGRLDLSERVIICHLQAVALGLDFREYPQHTGVVATGRDTDGFEPAAGLINNLVSAKTSNIVRAKEYGVAIDDDHCLVITEHVVEGEALDDSIIGSVPKLQIEYENRLTSTTYCYTRYQDDATALEVFDPGSTEPEMDHAEMDQYDEALERFLDEQERPRQADVELLIGQLLDAALIDATSPEGSAN